MCNHMCYHMCIIIALPKTGEGEESTQVRGSVSAIAGKFLKMTWTNTVTGEKEKGSKFNSHVESMLKAYLTTSPRPMEAIKDYVESKALEEVLSKEADYTSSEYPTFGKATLSAHFRILLAHLVTCVRSNLTFGTTKDHDAQYDIWSDAVSHLNKRVQVKQCHDLYYASTYTRSFFKATYSKVLLLNLI